MSPEVNLDRIPGNLTNGIIVAGAGVSGLGAARLLTQLGVRFSVADDNADNRRHAEEVIGAHTLGTLDAAARFSEFTTVVTSPGWRPDSPLLVAAQQAGLKVFSDVELCFRLDRAGVFGSPRTWLAITGTNGKTTTTGMLASIMAHAGIDTGLRSTACGNIGVAVSEALCDFERVDILVTELSSFQLHWSDDFVPDVGVLLNLAEDHIDWHGSFTEYARAKAKVFKAPIAIAGIDDTEVARLAEETGRSDIIGFTLNAPVPNQIGIVHDRLVYRLDDQSIDLASALNIEPAGNAGLLDALAASAVAVTQQVSPQRIHDGLAAYRVEAHRGVVVHSAHGVDWVDNSKATNPHAADTALGSGADSASAGATVVWVAGGQLKGADVEWLIKQHAHQFRAVALLGVDRFIISQAVQRFAPDVPVFVTDSTDPIEAMDACVRFAAEHAKPGDKVILAPAAASLDMYSGMSVRGDEFAAAAVRHSA